MISKTAGALCRFIGLAISLTILATRSLGDPPVLTWNDAAGNNLWDATSITWLDSENSPVAWQPGAEAHFDGAGGTVQIEADVSATNLVFSGGGYLLLGTGSLSLEGTAAAAAGTTNGIAAKLLSTAGIAKSGAGTLVLSDPNAMLTSAVAVAQGTLALQGATLPGALSVAAPATVASLPPASNGLMGFYYNNAAPSNGNYTSLEALEYHFAAMTPDLAAPSSLAGDTFDFGNNAPLFPLPYGLGGTHTNNFEAVWRGVITVPSSTYYSFHIISDDGCLLAIDRKTVVSLLGNATADGTVFLEAGSHDIVLGYFQLTGPSGIQVQVKALGDGGFAMLPNAWLKPYASVGALSGSGAAFLSANSAFNVAQKTAATFSGELAGPAGSLFVKSGSGLLTLNSDSTVSNAFAGDVSVQGGVLALSSGERIGDASTALIGNEAVLELAADETLAALSGPGTVALGTQSSVYVKAFSGNADSGISPAKIYTHLLDFPADGNPATVNGVIFTSAGMSGSTNGYSWSTVNPPSDYPSNAGSGVDQLVSDFCFNSTDYTLTLSGLRPGQLYETRLYFRSYVTPVDPDSPRKVTFSFTAGAAFIGAVDHSPDTVTRSIVGCRYTADATGTLSVRVVSHNPFHTCHLYGLSNEEAALVAPTVSSFNGDADCGISASKTYTHKLDFPADGSPATVNGVPFIAADMRGGPDANGYAWDTVNAPTMNFGNAGSGVAQLLSDFYYNSTDYTITLSGLHSGQSYEVCLYFRCYGDNTPKVDSTRDVTFTFKAGARSYGSVDHDLDTMARSMVRCSYTTDDAGTLAIHVLSHSTADTCHLYGLSNEEAAAPALSAGPTLTLDTPAGRTAYHTGGLSGYGTLIKKGSGTQVFGGGNSIASPLDVQAGKVILESGASSVSGVVVQDGATVAAPNGSVWLGSLEGAGTLVLGGATTNSISMVFFRDDAGTGISSSKVYSHKLDLGNGSSAAVINGVTFDKISSTSGTLGGYGWNGFPPNPNGGNAPPVVPAGSGIYNLLQDMDYGLQYPGSATMQLTGLTPGKRYDVRLYNRKWDSNVKARTQTVTFDPDGDGPISESVTFDPDSLDPNYIGYRYCAASSVLNITITSMFNDQTLHLYGLSNEEVASAPVEINTTRDCVFGGVVTGAGTWTKTGTASFTVTGAGNAGGALAVSAGAFGVADGGCATTGSVTVADGATLFGDGRVGGDVSVASNACLYAGTTNACGTLHVGGALTLAEGVQLVYRYSASGADTVTVDGVLTFPTNGVLYVSSLTAGLTPPAKDALFVSTQAIAGPADLTGWTVEGATNSSLRYSDDRKTIYFARPCGVLVLLR